MALMESCISHRPAKSRMFRSTRPSGRDVNRPALAVRQNSSSVIPQRVLGRSMAHTSLAARRQECALRYHYLQLKRTV